MLLRYWPTTSYRALLIYPSEPHCTASTSIAKTLPSSITVRFNQASCRGGPPGAAGKLADFLRRAGYLT